MRIGVIDDDKALLQSLAVLLSELGHAVTTFSDPVAAFLSLKRDGFPDLLIVDFVMPGVTPRTLETWLRTKPPADCTVILISGHTDLIQPLDLRAMGVTAFLPKPLCLEHLCRCVAERPKQDPGLDEPDP